jgi:hypothetical protein
MNIKEREKMKIQNRTYEEVRYVQLWAEKTPKLLKVKE